MIALSKRRPMFRSPSAKAVLRAELEWEDANTWQASKSSSIHARPVVVDITLAM